MLPDDRRFVKGLPHIATVVALLLGERSAMANPVDSFGLGSRSTAMGGAVTARVTDPSATYYNVSGLALAKHTSVSGGYVHLAPNLSLSDEPARLPSIDAWQVGLLVPGTLFDLPLAFGLSGQIAGDTLSRVVTFAEEDQRWFLYDTRPEQIYLSAALAVRPLPWLAIGGGFTFLASTRGQLQITGTAVQPFGDTDEYDSQLNHGVEARLTSVRYPCFGATFSPSPRVDLGVSYRGEGSVVLDVDSNIEGDVQLAPALRIPIAYALTSETVQSFVPRQLTVGGRVGVDADVDVHLDLSWVDWSEYPSPLSATSSELTARLPPGLTYTLPELPPPTRLTSARLSDRFVPRVGAEWRPAERRFGAWAIRAGYVFERSPVVRSSAPQLVDADRHTVSLGVGVSLLPVDYPATDPPSGASDGRSQWRGHHLMSIDAHAQLGILPTRRLPNTPDPDDTAGGNTVSAGLSLSLRL